MYVYMDFRIPERMEGAIERYIKQGFEPGDFLMAVLRNDLAEACGRADDENMHNLPAYISYLYNEAPSTCWGSPEKVAGWIQMHKDLRGAKENPE